MCDIKQEPPEMAASISPCPACLTRGRAMFPLRDAACTYAMLLAGLQGESNSESLLWSVQVCWECHRMLSKIFNFQNQVLKANTLLQGSTDLAECASVDQSLSKLSGFIKNGYDLQLTHEDNLDNESNTKKDRIEVKLEIELIPQEPDASQEDDPFSTQEPPKSKKRSAPTRLSGKREKCSAAKVLPSRKSNRREEIVTIVMSEVEMLKHREEARMDKTFAEAPYKCTDCIKVFSSEHILQRHQTAHHDKSNPYKCDVCNTYFNIKLNISKHFKKHYNLHVCSKCGFTDKSLHNLKNHYDAEHMPSNTYVCADCHIVFKTREQLRSHRVNIHVNNHQCHICNKKFANRKSLTDHIQTHTGVPSLECTVCKMACRGKKGLYNHMKIFHKKEGEEPPYCAECDKYFTSKDTYRTHLMKNDRHVDPEKLKYPCTKCQKKFTTSADLKQHDKRFHLEYICHICDKKLANSFSLYQHIGFVHEKKELPKKHVCEVCGKAFKRKADLQEHRVIHTGERPHSCDVCHATFAQRSSMNTHKKLVHLKQPRNIKKQRRT